MEFRIQNAEFRIEEETASGFRIKTGRTRTAAPLRGHTAGSLRKPAKSGLDRFVCWRADACGLGIDQVDCFFRLRGWRTRGLRSRPLVNHRSQRRGSSPLDSTPPTCVPRIFLQRCSMRYCLFCFAIKGFIAKPHGGLTGAFTKMSSTVNIIARSTPRRKAVRVRSFDFVEARRAQRTVRLGSSICSLHLCW